MSKVMFYVHQPKGERKHVFGADRISVCIWVCICICVPSCLLYLVNRWVDSNQTCMDISFGHWEKYKKWLGFGDLDHIFKVTNLDYTNEPCVHSIWRAANERILTNCPMILHWGPGAVARSEASSLGMQAAPSSIPTSGTFFCGDLVMKTFLRPFSLFRWFKKSSCQLLEKECALSTGKLPRRLAKEQFG